MKIDFAPMEALSVDELPKGKAWVYEPKWDGFRCLAQKKGNDVFLISKSGKPLERYFPDIIELLKAVKADFIVDGELAIFTEEGLSFSDLQLRLHPAASRVLKLAKEQPANFILFDLLETSKDNSLRDKSFGVRRGELEKLHLKFMQDKRLELSPQTRSLKTATGWLEKMRGTIDGIIAKNIDDAYRPGERAMQKYKPLKTADCVVGGFRYGSNSKLVGSLLLGLYDEDGKLNHVGFTSSIPANAKPALTKKLETLKEKPGFTGKAPGGPSRWSTERTGNWEPIKSELVAEVSFDHVSDDRFRHGTKLIRFRPDKAPSQCGMEQLYQ